MSTFAPMGGLPAGQVTQPGEGGLKDVLFNMFKKRQGGFGGVGGTGTELPGFPQQTPDAGMLPGGGLAYGFIDPNWFKDIIPEVPRNTMADVLTAINKKKKKSGDPDDGLVHGGPAQPPIEWDPNDPLGNLQMPPMPPPLGAGGHWFWERGGGGSGEPGRWVWIPGNPNHEPIEY